MIFIDTHRKQKAAKCSPLHISALLVTMLAALLLGGCSADSEDSYSAIPLPTPAPQSEVSVPVESPIPLSEDIFWYQKPFLEFNDIQPLTGYISDESAYRDVSVVTKGKKKGLIAYDGLSIIEPKYDDIVYDPSTDSVYGDGNAKITKEFNEIINYEAEAEEADGYFVWSESDKAIYFIGGEEKLYLYGPLYSEAMTPVVSISFNDSGMPKADYFRISKYIDLELWGFDTSRARAYVYYSPSDDSEHGQKRLIAYRQSTGGSASCWGYAFGKSLITPCVYSVAMPAFDGIGRVLSGDLWFYIAPDGQQLYPKGFSTQGPSCYDFSEGLAAVCENGKWGFIDRRGEVAVSFIYEAARPLRQGLAWVKQDGLWGILNLRSIERV